MNPDDLKNYSLGTILNSIGAGYLALHNAAEQMEYNSDGMDIYTKIRNGVYEVMGPYPVKPDKPYALQKMASALDDDEIASLREVKAQYEADTVLYKAAVATRRDRQAELYSKFADDLACEYGIDNKDLANKVYSAAYDRGHSSGLSDVANAYSDLASIAKAAIASVAPAEEQPDLTLVVKELRHLVKLLDGPLSNGDVQVPGLATLNGAKRALKIYDKNVLKEMRSFTTMDVRDSTVGIVTRHFDLLMAVVIGWQMR